MSARQRKRRAEPSRYPLEYAVACQGAINNATRERGQAFLSAASAGWSMREIADAVGVSASTVCRIINEHEERAS